MVKLKLLVAALCATVVISAPALAREHHARHRVVVSGPAAPDAIYLDGRACIPAPRVGAFATAPWGNGNIPCEPYGYGYYGYDGADAWNY